MTRAGRVAMLAAVLAAPAVAEPLAVSTRPVALHPEDAVR